ncbi:5'-3' exonuclease [Oceanicoccus sagamiensis]|uniref:Flap endonuclease n=1 Tax=Oceanicoccus sagamiensis TaxID=716816 RepID=A0A1X9NM65_9GAMM|nr:5'-3' exonuclease H3TH domain-containing protein [Oceanicoccus sagamiensis]ARN75897.1 flap endonuclease [Oceanicoccus sagamiensis]
MANSSQPIYLIDASIYIFRAYFSLPDEWHSPEGYSVNALNGYTQFILKFLQQVKPEQIAIAYDESLGSCFRNDIYPGYKASRVLPDEELAFQLAACKALTELMGIASFASERYEADDIIASLAHAAQQRGENVTIVSRDKDLGQILKHRDDIFWDYAADKRITLGDFINHYGVQAYQMTDFLALLGDSIDDIPGVPGIGKKTAAALLGQFGSIDAMYHDLPAVAASGLRGAKTLVEKLIDYREQIAMAQTLVRLEQQVPELDRVNLQWQPPSKQTVAYFLDEYALGQRFQRQLDNCYWGQ